MGFLGYKPSKLACEQALRGDLVVGWEKEGELAKFLLQFKKSKDYCKADLKQRILFFITIFRLVIPAFFRSNVAIKIVFKGRGGNDAQHKNLSGLQYPELSKIEKVELPLYYFNDTMKLFRMKPTEA